MHKLVMVGTRLGGQISKIGFELREVFRFGDGKWEIKISLGTMENESTSD